MDDTLRAKLDEARTRMNSQQAGINANRKHDDPAMREWARGKQRPANAERAQFRNSLTDEDRSQIDRLGCAAQLCLSRRRVLRQDARLFSDARYRPQRRRGVTTPSMTAGHERPREEWIEIPVPALVSEASFARAQELLQENKIRSRRRTIEPSVVQGLVSCQKCGYAFSRCSTRTSARKIHTYKCMGSDSWRKLGGPICDNRRLVRQDLLDQIVWTEVIRLLEEPTLIQQELDRRLAAARSSDPAKKHEQSLQRELITNAHRIRRGLMPDMREADPNSDFHFVERDDPDKIAATLVKLVQERIPGRFRLDPIRDVQVLCPMNRGSLGVRELNTALQRALNPASPRCARRRAVLVAIPDTRQGHPDGERLRQGCVQRRHRNR